MYIVVRKTLTMLYLHFYTSARVTMEMTTNVFPLSRHIAPSLRLLVPSSLQVRRQSVEENHRHRESVCVYLKCRYFLYKSTRRYNRHD
jgi:hypothetical protein